MMRIRGKRGFTLVEMLVVVLIIGVLVAIALPRFAGITKDAKINRCNANVHAMNTAIQVYEEKTSAWPSALTDVTGSTEYFPEGAPTCPFGTAYVYDTGSHIVTKHSH